MRDLTVSELGELHEDPRRCAQLAGLVYIDTDQPGISRRRRGTGFSYHGTSGRSAVDKVAKTRIAELAIPPAWRQVWICPDENGHLLATGHDDRGRKQYIYHPRWRELRDVVNFYRLLILAQVVPKVRRHVDAQLRRRTLDRERAIAGMIAILDATYLRIGNETYAEENDSFGLSTLTPEHVVLHRGSVAFSFPAKSGKDVEISLDDAHIVRLVRQLNADPGARLFTVDSVPIDSAEVNATLAEVCGEHITAKDFRTWGGTLAAFTFLRKHRTTEANAATLAVAAVDEAADVLRNTRAVARAHYVHPHLLQTYVDGTFDDCLRRGAPTRTPGLEPEERALEGFLRLLLATAR